MFIETVTLPEDEWRLHHEGLRITLDPPDALVASVSWAAGDGEVVTLNVWDTPGASPDFFVDRVAPIIEEHGMPSNKPERGGDPKAIYIREPDSEG